MELPGQEGAPLLPQGAGDVFVAKMDATGAVLWARQSLGDGDNRLADLVVDSKAQLLFGWKLPADSFSY